MKLNYLNKYGEIETLSMQEIKKRTGKNISWELMHNISEHKCCTQQDKKDYEYLKKYLEKVSVFDWNNFKEWGFVQVYEHFVNIAIKNGAVDKRIKGVEE